MESLGWGPATRLDLDDNSAQPGSPTGAAVSQRHRRGPRDRSRHPHRRRDQPRERPRSPGHRGAAGAASCCAGGAPRARARRTAPVGVRLADASPSATAAAVGAAQGAGHARRRPAVAAEADAAWPPGRRSLSSYTQGAFLGGTTRAPTSATRSALHRRRGRARPGATRRCSPTGALGSTTSSVRRGAPHGVRLGARARTRSRPASPRRSTWCSSSTVATTPRAASR